MATLDKNVFNGVQIVTGIHSSPHGNESFNGHVVFIVDSQMGFILSNQEIDGIRARGMETGSGVLGEGGRRGPGVVGVAGTVGDGRGVAVGGRVGARVGVAAGDGGGGLVGVPAGPAVGVGEVSATVGLAVGEVTTAGSGEGVATGDGVGTGEAVGVGNGGSGVGLGIAVGGAPLPARSGPTMAKAAAGGASSKRAPEQIHAVCAGVKQVEKENDRLLRRATAKLFREESDAKVLIKWKEIYDVVEMAIDTCEDVANVIESVVLENA